MVPLTGTTLAHGVGSRQDLPIPFAYALVGAVVAVVVSFLVLGVWWRKSRLRGDGGGRPIPYAIERVVDGRLFRVALRVVGLVLAGFAVVAAALGPDDRLNPTAGLVYVWLWVGLVPASLLFGPVWRLLNPLRTVHRGFCALFGLSPDKGFASYPAGLGYWPAALGLAAFTWLELVAPSQTSTKVLLLWFTAYACAHLLGALAFGSRWFARADAFEVYSTMIGRLAPIGRRVDGRLVVRNPLDGLDGLAPAPGLVVAGCVLLGSTAYDGFSGLPWWIGAAQTAPVLWGTAGLAVGIALASALFVAGTGLAGRLGTDHLSATPRHFAHSIIPIAVGYLIAHYFSLLVFEGQHTLILASDPLGTGANLFGTAERGVDYGLVSATAIATIQVVAVVLGHVAGVIAAHDRAVRRFTRQQAIVGQIPLLVLMVGYTVGGLTLLFAA